MKKVIILLFFLNVFSTSFVRAVDLKLEIGKWNFADDEIYCIIGSYPIKQDIPEGKKRGDTFVLVYRMNKSPDAIIEIRAGYPYDEKKPVEIKIDKNSYKFYSKDDSAWTSKDKEVIFAMKKGDTMIIKGLSSKGTITIDTYTLKGFTVALNKLSKDC